MPRRSRRRPEPERRRVGGDHTEARRDGEWMVRPLNGSSGKDYTCPGCHRPVPEGTPHVLVWPAIKPLLSEAAIDERRHWHTACWQRAR